MYPEIDLHNRFPSYDRLNKQILEYKLSVFNPSAYVKPDKQKKYEDLAASEVLAFKQTDRENFLIGMMKINYLKRLESSIESFEISMDRTIQKIENLENKIKEFLKSNARSQEESLESVEPDEDELEENADDLEQWQVGKKLKFDLADLELERWLNDLKKDKVALVDLYNKLCELFNAETNNGEKMDAYTALLKKAVVEIIHIFKKRGTQRLTSDRGALLIPFSKQITEMENFELVTWLIVS